MKFNNVNPSLLLKEFNEAGINIKVINSNLKIGATIANEAWCDIPEDTNINKLNEIVEKHNPNKTIESEPSEGEILMSNVILENATLKQQMTEQQELTANLLLQIAELKGGNANV
ncbi:hypothetical protein [Clostridium butyricum]|uniref:hypothetical protein n=1 Tax=Clostridium butyricum TaxID=1492 RepID=UPI00374F3C19